MDFFSSMLLVPLVYSLLGAVIFTAIGLVSGSDETATIAPLTLLVVLLGAPPEGVFAFFMAAAVAKHMAHAIPTALLGIPGDTMAMPLMREANLLRALGVPHIAVRKMVSGAAVAAFVSLPLAVLFAVILSPYADVIKAWSPWIFLCASIVIAYFSPGRMASVIALVPFVMVIAALRSFTTAQGTSVNVSYFLGIAVGPLIADLVRLMSPVERAKMRRSDYRTVSLAPDMQSSGGYLPNPLKVLDSTQTRWTTAAAVVSSATFVFSPVAMTVIMGEMVATRAKQAYHRLTSMISVRNGVTEATYIAETLIPLIAFGLPLSPVAVGPAAPLFNAPPRFTIDTATGQINNLHSMMNVWEFLGYGLLAVAIACLIAYPFAIRFAHRAAKFVMSRVCHEAIIAGFVGLVVVIGIWEGGMTGLLVTLTMGVIGGFLNRALGFGVGVQCMGFYTAVLSVPAILAALK
ncbi:Tripartite tricarboxylate transporter TctA family protein [Bordetella tumbae]|uniref:tripartite tricarboxylate transporter permease n=1 Tax=Bordetella tumbae TaxID=1649139 RepID=UPI0039F02C8F